MLNVEGSLCKLQIWDTAGQESFRSITRAYYSGATAALLVYDISRKSSFSSLGNWINEISMNANANIIIILVGNKTDLEAREVTRVEGEQFAEEHGLIFMETSARTGINVQEVFRVAAVEVMRKIKKGEIILEQNSLNVSNPVLPKKTKCCTD